MTRETKIGLLVGLAFIIVIGILLSDHFASTMQPPPAQLLTATDNVLRSYVTPGAKTATTDDVRIDGVKPNKRVALGSSGNDGKVEVKVGPSDTGTRKPVDTRQPDPVAKDRNDAADNIDARNNADNNDHQEHPVGTKPYTAEKGDSLSKIAAKMMGKNTKANRDAIAKANPSLQKNPDSITAGKVYLIPTQDAQPSVPPGSSTGDTRTALIPTPSSETIYTTKPGDNLWRIAVDQVGSGTAVSQIRDLNKDVLKKGDTIVPGMKLRLPPKQVASAN